MTIITFIIILVATFLNLLILFYIIRGASRSNALVELQTAQLKVLVETALAQGVNPDKVLNERKLLYENMIGIARKQYNSGKIKQTEFNSLVQSYQN